MGGTSLRRLVVVVEEVDAAEGGSVVELDVRLSGSRV